MSPRNWGLITNGATFESLVRTLIFFEDPRAALFGRRGCDGGQDVRSGDGTLVYQAKHHINATAALAMQDAQQEATKIERYRSQGGKTAELWRGVERWRLVTNAVFNPYNDQDWQAEVQPTFEKLGIEVDYWSLSQLDALLTKHPEVDRCYFENENRVFLSLPEAKEVLLEGEAFLKHPRPSPFVGRDKELDRFRAFAQSEQRFLLVHGPGGIGKSRFVFEAGSRLELSDETTPNDSWQVLWANVESMQQTSQWFSAIVPERRTLLIVDETRDENLLRILAEQLSGRSSLWKIVVTARSSNDSVLRFLRGVRIRPRVSELVLKALSPDDAVEMACELIGAGEDTKMSRGGEEKGVAKALAERFSNHPIWLALGASNWAEHRDWNRVPEDAGSLADAYLEDATAGSNPQSSEQLQTILRWVSIVGPLNRQDKSLFGELADRTELEGEGEIQQTLKDLVERRILRSRGAYDRLVEVKPDVLKDRVLRNWLTSEPGFGPYTLEASRDANDIARQVAKNALNGTVTRFDRQILVALAQTTESLRIEDSGHANVDLLAAFMQELRDGIPRASLATRATIIKLLASVAWFRPDETLTLLKAARSAPIGSSADQTHAGSSAGSLDHVTLHCTSTSFHIARGLQKEDTARELLGELCELVTEESRIQERRGVELSSDGTRASRVLEQVIAGGPQFAFCFDEVASQVALVWLERVGAKSADEHERAACLAIVEPTLSVERRQSWSDGDSFHIRTVLVNESHPAWDARLELLKRIKQLLAVDDISDPSRRVLWSMFAKAHRSLNNAYGYGGEPLPDAVQTQLLEELKWAHDFLSKKQPGFDELSAARELWAWHVQFEKDPERRKAAEKLESLYSRDELASEFAPLCSRDDEAASKKASDLAQLSAEQIDGFLRRAHDFFSDSDTLVRRLAPVARSLGEFAVKAPEVERFVYRALGDTRAEAFSKSKTQFANRAVVSWVFDVRWTDAQGAARLVQKLYSKCGGDGQRVSLLSHIYTPPPTGSVCDGEHDFLRSTKKVFLNENHCPALIHCVGWGVDYRWDELKALIEGALDHVVDDESQTAWGALFDAIKALIEVFYCVVVLGSTQSKLPSDLTRWMLDQAMRVADLGNLSGEVEFEINEILEQTGRLPIEWLPTVIARRSELEKSSSGYVQALNYHLNPSRFVEPIGQADRIDPEVEACIARLVSFVSDTGSIRHHLAEVLQEIDPHGRVVPEQVAAKFQELNDRDHQLRLARLAGGFVENSEPWRTIATAVLAQIASGSSSDQTAFRSALTSQRPDAWSSVRGEVPSVFTSAVANLERHLEAEQDLELRAYWDWRLESARAELREWQERAREERGE